MTGHLVQHILNGAVGGRGTGCDGDGERPLWQPVLRRRQLPPRLQE